MKPSGRNIFIGNIPYGFTEEQLMEIFRTAGRVVSMRLVFDKETGKPKGYGFCEFQDIESASCAVRNLNNYDIQGRQLRVDFAESDPVAPNQQKKLSEDVSLKLPGSNLPPGVNATDFINKQVSAMAPSELLEVLTKVKMMIQQDTHSTRILLQQNPQLTYALFHALISLNLIDPSTIQQQLEGFQAQQTAMQFYPQQPQVEYQQEQQKVSVVMIVANANANYESNARTNQFFTRSRASTSFSVESTIATTTLSINNFFSPNQAKNSDDCNRSASTETKADQYYARSSHTSWQYIRFSNTPSGKKVFIQNAQPNPVDMQHAAEFKKKQKALKRFQEQQKPRTPDPVDGRKNMDIQTDVYLEELVDKVPESMIGTQTDAFLERPPSPLFIPTKTGIDVFTQILDGELFDFDLEVEPILQVLIGKTMEQAMLEVMEEDELELLKKRQMEFEAIRNAELVEVQRLEQAEKRRTEEKEKRIQEALKLEKEKENVRDKIEARVFSQKYMADLVPSVFKGLVDAGYYHDEVEKEVETSVLPWLAKQVNARLEQFDLARKVVDDIILNAIRQKNAMQ